MKRKVVSLALATAMAFGTMPPAAVFAEDGYATRGEVCDMLLNAADDYNPGVTEGDILKGRGDGQLHEDQDVTRAEALVMLRRAFGDIPEILGDNKYIAIPDGEFTDIPGWAEDEIADVIGAGIVEGKAEGVFAPDDKVTKDEMELLLRRVYRIFGTNPRDDFYEAVNRDVLDNIVIPDGHMGTGTTQSDAVTVQLTELVKEISASNPDKSSRAGKIKTVYDNYMNTEARNAQGYEPIKPYLDEIDAAESVADFIGTRALQPIIRFSAAMDPMDSNSFINVFSTVSINSKEMYEGKAEGMKASYLKYLRTLFTLTGYTEEEAAAAADEVFGIEGQIAEASLAVQETVDITKVYNIYTLDEICALFKSMDIEKLFEASGLKNRDRFLVLDEGAMKKAAELFDDKNLDALKAYLKASMIAMYAQYMSEDFKQAHYTYNAEINGTSGSMSPEAEATNLIDVSLKEFLGEAYAEKYADEKTKADITAMTNDMIDIYRERIRNLDWMSDATKEKAIKKLDTMEIKVCAPEKFYELTLDGLELRSYAEGGSLVENLMTISDAALADMASFEGTKVDRERWYDASPQTVNAFYNPQMNDITICEGLLQMPGVYSPDASYEKNLGAIGTVIGHELSHAFDINGSQFDENGNAVNWWTEEDRAAFMERCQAVIEFYDGCEAAPGMATDGARTLAENTADMGGISVVTELASRVEDFDYKEMYESFANLFLTTMYRPALEQIMMIDVHSQSIVRVNRPLQASDKFFEVYGITENDGMWVAPEDRVSIW